MEREEVKRPVLRGVMTAVVFCASWALLFGSEASIRYFEGLGDDNYLKLLYNILREWNWHQAAAPLIVAGVVTGALYPSIAIAASFIEKRWPKRDRPPHRWLADTIGRLRFAFGARQRRALFAGFELRYAPIVPDFAMVPLGHEPLSLVKIKDKYYTIITGPPGAGKTTYLSALVNDVRHKFDLPVALPSAELAQAVEANDPAFLWSIIKRSIIALPTEHSVKNEIESTLPSTMLAYMLNRRSVLLIVNDLHTVPRSANEVITFIVRYFMEHHRWAQHVSLICTTREAEEALAPNIVNNGNVIALRPLMQREAQELFYNLCCQVGLEDNALLACHEELTRSFAVENLRVPLFIVLSAWLVSPHRGEQRAELPRVLGLTATQLFNSFLRALYLRGVQYFAAREFAQSAEAVEHFRRVLDSLACDFWPKWEHLHEPEAAERLARLAVGLPSGLPQLDMQFMLSNGLLFRDQLSGAVRFAHEALADYLTASEMVRRRNYSQLSLYRNSPRLDGIAAMLAELIEQREAFEPLFYWKLDTALRILREPEFETPVDLDFRAVARQGARWASSGAPHPVTPTEWNEFCAFLLRDGSRRGLNAFLSEIREESGPSPQGVTALVSMGVLEARALLEAWISDARAEESIKDAASAAGIQEALVQIARNAGIESPYGRRVFDLLWRGGKTEWLRSLLESGQRKELSFLVKRYKRPMITCLAQIAACENIQRKQFMSEICVESFSRALVSPGEYEVASDGGTRTVVMSMPMLVPCLATDLGDFSERELGRAQAALAMEASKLMDTDEVGVVARYFQHDLVNGRKGVMFKGEPDTCEAFKETIARIWFFHLRSGHGRTVAIYESGDQSTKYGGRVRNLRIVFRLVDRLS